MANETGWKPTPLSLKVIFILSALWIVGSIFAVPGRYELGLPFFGIFIYGLAASAVVLLLDILGPLTFLIGLWKRKPWAPKVALAYIAIFILNSIVAMFTAREQLGLMPILIPTLINTIFLIIIYKKRNYFN